MMIMIALFSFAESLLGKMLYPREESHLDKFLASNIDIELFSPRITNFVMLYLSKNNITI